MSFPRYPHYKDSGVNWLGQIPEHWRSVPVKHIGRLKGGAGFPHERQGVETEEIPFHKVNALAQADRDGVLGVSSNTVSRETARNLGAFVFPPNSIVFAKVGAALLLGRIRLLDRDSCIDNNMMGLVVCQKEFCVRYVIYAMSLVRFDLIANPGTVPSLNEGQIGDFQLAAPGFEEQTAIAAFLDRETAKIDALVAEQQRLMALLKEKRQAVISDVVTGKMQVIERKRADGTSAFSIQHSALPMKPSGIEWLGDVPAHWSVAPVSSRYSVQLGKMLDSVKITGEHLRPYLRVFDVQWGYINTDELPQMDFDENAREKFRLIPGDLLVNEGGSYPGRSALWSGQIGECYYQKALHRIRPHRPKEDTTRFIFYLMSWAANHGVFTAGGNEATIEHLPAEKLRRYRFAFPSIKEQIAIADFLDAEAAKLDTLTAEAQRAINLLQERRTALISAAVTGQIDVRNTHA